VQDPERIGSETLDILLKMKRIDELTLHFKGQVMGGQSNGQTEGKPTVTGLTFIHTTTQKDAKRLLTTDFNADPNVSVLLLAKTHMLATKTQKRYVCRGLPDRLTIRMELDLAPTR
jgi:hypothetical protein